MRRHLWMHLAMLGVVIGLWALRSAGVSLPGFVVYAVVLACPLMMVSMFFGMHRHEHEAEHEPAAGAGHAAEPVAAPSVTRDV